MSSFFSPPWSLLIELIWIKIMQNSPALILGNCYRPPSDFQFYSRFYDFLEKCGLGIGMCCPSVIWIRTILVATRDCYIIILPVGNQGHPITVFYKISVRRSKYFLEFSFAWERLKISRLLLHSCTIFEAYLILKSPTIFKSLIFHISVLRLGYFS